MQFPSLIPGITAQRFATVLAPYNRLSMGEAPLADGAAIEHALAIAHALFRNRKAWLPLPKRIEILERAQVLLKARAEEFAMEAAREGGKPLLDSRVEVSRAIDSLRLCVEAVRREAGEVIPMGITASSMQRLAFTTPEPIGVVVAVSAFNHPLNLIAHQVGPAIAAGCPVIVKPARSTPLTCFRFVQLLREAGLPEDWCIPLLPESNALTSQLACDPRVAFLSFIGSASVGWELRSKLAPGARCALEHGGVAPVIVAADADLDSAVPLLAKGGYYHAGQVCVSVQRVFADRAIAAELAERLAAAASRMIVGDPTDAATEIGPLIEPAETQRIHQWVSEATASGAKLVCGGAPISASCYAASLLLNPPETAKISREEIFGPVVAIYGVDSIDTAIARANSLPYAFQAAVFTRNIDTALACARQLDASAVMVNDHTAFRVDWMPFAGLRSSGLGVGGIEHSLRDMQVQKMIVLRSASL